MNAIPTLSTDAAFLAGVEAYLAGTVGAEYVKYRAYPALAAAFMAGVRDCACLI